VVITPFASGCKPRAYGFAALLSVSPLPASTACMSDLSCDAALFRDAVPTVITPFALDPPLPLRLLTPSPIKTVLAARAIVVILLRNETTACCDEYDQECSLLMCGIAAKGADLLRLVADPHMLTDPARKALYADLWGRLSPPQPAHICQLIMNAREAFPAVDVCIGRCDVSSTYHQSLYSFLDIFYQYFLFEIDSVAFVAIPKICTFGLQTSDYEFGVLTEFFAALRDIMVLDMLIRGVSV
jgi:hypothetical protein